MLAHSASLYVGDLPKSVTEGNLFEVFKSAGPLSSIYVCRDTVTRRSLGYAYVNYINASDAEKALENLNGHVFSGRPCRVMWVQRDPSVRKSGVGNIFIKNLEKSITHKELYDTFSDFGNILSAKVSLHENGDSKGFGFVHFEKQEDADKAIALVNGKALKGQAITVERYIPKAARSTATSRNFTNLYLKDFPLDWGDDAVAKVFSAYGEIQNVALPKTPDGKTKGFGFVNFKTHESALKAIDALNGREFDSADGTKKKIYVARFQKKTERQLELRKKREEALQTKIEKWRGTNLYIKNIDDSITEAALKEEFAKFGPISSGVIMRDDKKISKGFGFICFDSPEQAEVAIAEMHGKMLAGKPLYVALAQRKEERRAQLEQHHQRKRIPMAFPPPGGAMPPYYGGAPGGPGFFPPPAYGRGFARGFIAPYGAPFPGQHAGGRPSGERRRPPTSGPRAAAAPAPAAAPPVAIPSESIELSEAQLNALDPRAQAQLLGEKLFPKIQRLQPIRCGKITGMLLERYKTELRELLKLLNNEKELELKVNEAVAVLEAHERSPADGN